MISRTVLGPLLLSALLALSGSARAEDAAAGSPHELTVVVVDSLRGESSSINLYDRIAEVFSRVFERRKWPVKVRVERFGGDTPEHPTELRVFVHGFRLEGPGELTFSAWMTLTDHGKKTDFGVIRARYNMRPYEAVDDRLDRVIRGSAEIAADRIEDVLFTKPGRQKP